NDQIHESRWPSSGPLVCLDGRGFEFSSSTAIGLRRSGIHRTKEGCGSSRNGFKMKAAIYARVSTAKQKYEMQLTELRDYTKRQNWDAVEYTEKESSVKRRPEFERLM